MTTETLIIIQLALIVVLLLKDFLFSFVKEKGKNLATRQDIQGITEKIEDVKSLYVEKIENLKASLQISTYEQNKITDSSLSSLLAFYDTSLLLIKDNLSRNFGDMTGQDLGETLWNFQSKTEDLFIKQNIEYHRLLIFLGSEKAIVTQCAKLVDISQKVKAIFKKHFGHIKIAMVRENEALKSSEEAYRHAVGQTNLYTSRYYDEVKPLFEQLDKELGQFIELMIAYLRRKHFIE